MNFTYYCETHRTETATGSAPSVCGNSGVPIFNPVCPRCNERMFYVPNGETRVPDQQAAYHPNLEVMEAYDE